jgi:hypothetical protein
MTGIGRASLLAVLAARIATHRSVGVGQYGIAVIDVRSRESADLGAPARRTYGFFTRRCPIRRFAGPQIVVRGRFGRTGRNRVSLFLVLLTRIPLSCASHVSAPE